MTTAIILAGGSGTRLGASIPKQFIEVNNKPILVYTLERFQCHPMVDSIIVVCIAGWEQTIHGYISQYGISKIDRVLAGGASAIESIRIGVTGFTAKENDIILIHDGVRPMVNEMMITDAIKIASLHGAAMSAIPLKEHIFILDENGIATSYLPRDNGFRSSTPQAYQAHILRKAFTLLGNRSTAYTSTLMIDTGTPLFLSYGSEKNFKITTKHDIELFKALLQTENA